MIILLGGLIVGMLMGALGGGGAILAIPLLVYGLGMAPQEATVISLIVVGLGAAAGAVTHARAGSVRLGQGLLFGALGVLGSFAGSRLSPRVDSAVLMGMFAGLLVVVAVTMIRKARGAAPEPRRAGWPALVGTATAVGFLTGFFGVGGGFAIVPALVLVLGFEMTTAVGTSLVVIAVNSLVSLGMHADQIPLIQWDVAVPFAVTAMAATLLGGRISRAVPKKQLQLGFAALLLCIAAYTAAQTLPQLIG